MKKQLLLIVSVLSLNIAFALSPSFYGTIILPNGPNSWSNSFSNLTLKGIKVINKQMAASQKMDAIMQKNADVAEKSSQTVALTTSLVVSSEESSMFFVDTTGDYKSAGNGAWTSLSSWQYYNGSGWVTPTVGQGYPGQFSGTNNVTIETGDTITIPNTFIMPEAIGNLSVHGVLSMGNGSGSDREITIKSNNVTIGANGNLFFNGSKVTLILPNSNAVIIILSGGVITYGSCSVNNRIFIGTNLYSTCNGGGGSGVVAFGNVVASGGSINAEITNPIANPIDLCGTGSLTFTGKYIGSETNVDYVWTVRNPNNVTSTIATGSLANSSATTNTSFTPSSPGQYLISFQVTINSFTNIETRTVNVYSLLDYANLQFPASATICESESLTAYGQVYKAGVTEGSNGQAPNILAEFGYSSTDSNPNTWTNWMSAQFNTETGENDNNDEYQYVFTPTSVGTYYYTFRYSINGCEWQYGGTNNGFWNGTGNNSGVLTVTPQPTWYADNDGDGFGNPDSSLQACSQPANYVSDNLDCDDDNSAINPNAQEICDGVDNNCNGTVDDGVLNADSSLATLNLSDGTLSPAFSANILSYSTEVCYNTSSITISATASNSNAVVAGAGNYNLVVGSNPLTITVDACGITTSYTINVTRLSNDTSLSSLSASDVSLSPSFNPNTLNYSGSVCNATTSTTISAIANNPATTVNGTGTLSLNEGTNTFNVVVDTSCETRTYTITIFRSSLIDYANLQFPGSDTICQGNSTTAYGQVYESGLTDASGIVVANIEAQFAINSSNTNPATWPEGIWSIANPTPGYNFTQNNDEYAATFGSALSPGAYYYTFRYRLNGCDWQYGGYPNGFWNGTSQNNGTLTVLENHTLTLFSGNTNQTVCPNSPISDIVYSFGGGATSLAISPTLPTGLSFNTITGTLSGAPTQPGTYNYTISTVGNSCSSQQLSGSITAKQLLDYGNLQFPGSATICSGSSIDAYGRIYEPGITPNAGSPGAIVDAEYGYGNNPDPLTWTNWFDATYNVQVGNDDEYKATFGSTLATGTYYYTFRYSLDGCEWQYGGYTSNGGGFLGGSNLVGVLTVNSAPVITNNYANINVTTDPNMCGATVSYSAATTTGTPAPSISYSTPSGSLFSVGTTNVTVTATNDCGTDTKTFTVTVTDNQAPTVVCQNITVPLDANGNASINASQLVSSSSDNCGIASVTASKTNFNCNDVTTSSNAITDLFFSEYVEGSSSNKYIEIYNGTGSNVDLSNYELRLYANGSPTATTTNALSGTLANGSTVVYRNSAATIYAGTSSILSSVNWNGDDAIALWKISTNSAVDIFGRIGNDPGTAWTGANGYTTVDKTLRRKSSVTQGITISPAGTGSGAFTTLTTEWDVYNIDTVSGLGSHTGPSTGATGIPVTVTITDINGISSTCTATVTVIDSILPVITTNGDQTLNNDTGLCGAIFTPTASATDNCSVDEPQGIRSDNLPLDAIYPVGTTTIAWNTTDVNGNDAAEVLQTIIVSDNEVPTVVCQNITVQLDSTGSAYITAAQLDGGSTDNCGIASIFISDNSFDCEDVTVGGNTIPASVWINEIHYDNDGGDVGEFVEIAGTSGFDLTGYSIVLYNGSGGVTYDSDNLSGSIGNDSNGYGAVHITYPSNGIQNGSPDGLALVNNLGNVIEFLSYEGTFTATNGPASGMTSTDIGVSEPGTTPLGQSLQKIGTGNQGSQFTWTGPATASPGALNSGQNLTASSGGTGVPVTLTVTDASGNSTNCTAYVTVVDNILPVITTNGNQNLNNDTGLCGAIFTPTASATDNCSVDVPQGVRSDNQPLDAIYPVGTTTIAWNTTDVNGNDAEEVIQTIVVSDNQVPTVECQDITVELDSTGSVTITTAQLDGGSSDNCGIASITVSQTTFDCGDVASEVTPALSNDLFISEYIEGGGNNKCIEIYNGTGASVNLTAGGYNLFISFNGGSTTSTIGLNGTIANGDVFVICNSSATALFTSNADLTTGNLNFNGDDAVALKKGSSNIDIFGRIGEDPGTYWSADSNRTENRTLVRNSNVTDGNTSNVSGFPSLGTEWTEYPQDTSSYLGNHTVTSSNGESGVPVTLTVTDIHGNSSNCTAYVTVVDNIAPTISCPGNTTQGSDIGVCGATITYSVTSNDNCAGYTVEQTAGLASGSVFPVGVTTNTFVVTDTSGNTSTCSFDVTINDTENPVAICPADISVSNDPGECGAIVNFTPNFTDNCAGGSVVATPASGSFFNKGTTEVTVLATDALGNTMSCTFNVTVNDTEAPLIACLDLQVYLNEQGNGAITAEQITQFATDNCEIASVTISQSNFDCSDIGGDLDDLIISEYVDGDNFENYIELFNGTGVTVDLTEYSLLVYYDGSSSPAVYPLGGSITDRQTAVISHPDASFAAFLANNTALLTFDGNDAIALMHNGTIVDLLPVYGSGVSLVGTTLIRNPDVNNGNVSSATGSDGWTQNNGAPIANLGDHNIVFSDNENNVELIVTDTSGNSSTCIASVAVIDNTPPVIECQNITIQLDDTGNVSITADDIELSSIDACGIASLSLDKYDFACDNVGPNEVTLTVTDTNGNTATCTATVTVVDDVDPVVNTQNITVQLNASGTVSITPNDVDNMSSDACGIETLSVSPNSFTCSDVGQNTVTLTATDVNGNSASATAIVTVEDNVVPVAICQNITVALDANGYASITGEDVDGGSSDACGIAFYSVSPSVFGCENIGANPVVLTVTDINGNSSSCNATVTITGIVPSVSITENPLPEFCQGAVVVLTANTAQPPSDIRSYAWSGVGITGPTTGQSISVSGNGTYTVTVTSETNCSTTVSYTVTGFDAGVLISSYTILANQEVFLHGNNLVQTGAVGATAASGLIKLHQATTVVGLGQAANFSLNQGSSVGTQINQPANPTIPAFVFNTQSNTNSPDVTINNGTNQMLTGSVYDVITIKQGATVTFTQSNVFINEIKTFENAKIEFSGCTNVYLNEKLMLARGGVINSAGNNVVFYVNEDVQIEQGSNVRARIHLNGHEILAKGANATGNNVAEPTYMTGLFIANSVHGNKNVIWNADTICEPCATSSGGAQSPVANNGFKLNAFTISAWPNPSDTEFNLKLNTQNTKDNVEITVFDMNNKLVHTNSFNPNETYRFGKELPGGVYIVRIVQGKDIATDRLVKY